MTSEHEHEHERAQGQDLPVTPLVMPDGTHQGYVRGDGRVALFNSPAEKALREALHNARQEADKWRGLVQEFVDEYDPQDWWSRRSVDILARAKQALEAPAE